MSAWRSRARRLALWAAASYAGFLAYAWLLYPRVLYPAPPERRAWSRPAGCEELALPGDRVTVRALAWRAPPGRGTVVWFHGNGELVEDLAPLGARLAARGLGVYALEYRGYGRSAREGRPSEPGLYADADALTRHARAAREGGRGRVVLVGYSLGSAIAAELGSRGLADRVVLVSAFTSITDVASRIVPVLPARLFMAERFETLAKVGAIDAPLLVVHGAKDELVPFDMGYAIAGAARRARMVTIAEGRHGDVLVADGGRALDEIERFALDEAPDR